MIASGRGPRLSFASASDAVWERLAGREVDGGNCSRACHGPMPCDLQVIGPKLEPKSRETWRPQWDSNRYYRRERSKQDSSSLWGLSAKPKFSLTSDTNG